MIWTKTPPITHCKHGHEYTPENTVKGTNGRGCRTCRRARKQILTGAGKGGFHRNKTHCIHGHAFDEENTLRHTVTGYRRCKKCAQSRDVKRSHRNRHVSLKYGISAHDVEIMKQVQDFRCAICGKHETEMLNHIKLCVDHSHVTNEVRSLLCVHCNHGLGSFKDNVTFIRNAARYLDLHNYAYGLKVRETSG